MSWEFENIAHVDCLSQNVLHTAQDNPVLDTNLVEEFPNACGSAQVFATWL